ncbi:MAG: GIY-YIG nuclease family protein [Candidatus Gracilibacteria bacterium]
MQYIIYILKSLKDGKRYVGMTKNLPRRIRDHELGLVKSTKHRRPLQLIYKEKFKQKSEAILREKFFKTGSGRNYLKTLNL